MSEPSESPAGKGKKVKNYSDNEMRIMVEIIHDMRPISSTEWKEVEARFNATEGTQTRDVMSLKRKYYKLTAEKGGTGNPLCKDYVRKAKAAAFLIAERSEAGDGTSVEGEFGTVGTEEEENSDSDIRQMASEHNLLDGVSLDAPRVLVEGVTCSTGATSPTRGAAGNPPEVAANLPEIAAESPSTCNLNYSPPALVRKKKKPRGSGQKDDDLIDFFRAKLVSDENARTEMRKDRELERQREEKTEAIQRKRQKREEKRARTESRAFQKQMMMFMAMMIGQRQNESPPSQQPLTVEGHIAAGGTIAGIEELAADADQSSSDDSEPEEA